MKNRALILLAFVLLSCSTNRQKAYDEKMQELSDRLGSPIDYSSLIYSFKYGRAKYPESLMEVYLAYKEGYPDQIDELEEVYFIDIFSRDGKWIGYFPIYDSLGERVVSYVLLSAGIDGKLDNVIDPPNKLHIDNWKQELRLYNPNEFDYTGFRKTEISTRPYSTREARTGNKDLLIYVYHLFEYNCFDEFMNNN